ncbi:hypothetical protein [Corallococcus carmarthensis]|uniref:YtkA-like domain-containing protein n=1 Tax=Corallococcus carmarthensis TaxID=2316728 RepID=A0A3A8K4R7_9BACT|nr:hypothetical protein [Corallococcus carmarthensis]NOK17473.1 hypothetical protein [Corallococcus carmarthensis]RKH02169.1 hypothetical protein D7X32_17755 [Corallococcus carmarthensis]
MTRALVAVLAGVVMLSACTEGVSPLPPPTAVKPGQGGGSVTPVDPTDVLAGGGSVARPPPPAQVPGEEEPPPDEVVEEEPPPVALPPPSGSAAVVGAGAEPTALSEVLQVDVDFVVSGVRNKGLVDVEFIAPGGRPYEKRSATVEAPPEETRTLRYSLPVAGTPVSMARMTGTWQVRFFLDGAQLAATSFTLEP